jgi:hypothetical protein
MVNGSVSTEGQSNSGDPKEMERKGKRMAAAAMYAQAPSSADYAAAANDAEAQQKTRWPGLAWPFN